MNTNAYLPICNNTWLLSSWLVSQGDEKTEKHAEAELCQAKTQFRLGWVRLGQEYKLFGEIFAVLTNTLFEKIQESWVNKSSDQGI